VDQVILGLGIEGITPREIVQGGVHLLEIPGIAQLDLVAADLGLRRNARDVEPDTLGQAATARVVQQFQAIDDEFLLLAQGHRRPPFIPARRTLAGVIELGTEKADDHSLLGCHEFIHKYKLIAVILLNPDKIFRALSVKFMKPFIFHQLTNPAAKSRRAGTPLAIAIAIAASLPGLRVGISTPPVRRNRIPVCCSGACRRQRESDLWRARRGQIGFDSRNANHWIAQSGRATVE
jgi:hypothetical protein